jgi:hypothetical protein
LYRCALGLNAHIDIQDGGKGAIFCIAGKGATILVLITGGPRFHWHYTDIAYRSIGAIDHLKEKKIFLKFTSHRSTCRAVVDVCSENKSHGGQLSFFLKLIK